MRSNGIRQRLNAGVPSFGAGLIWPSPEMAELCGGLGFDWLWLDLEHGPFDMASLSHTVRAAESTGMDTIARLPKTTDPGVILRVLETGVTGLIVPHVRGRADIDAVVSAAKYPPLGKRSAGTMRGPRWSPVPDYFERVNADVMILALVEEVEGIENIDEILGVAELDGVVIGFGDLSVTMGHSGRRDHPDVLRIGTAAQEKVLAAGKILQVTTQDGADAAEWVRRGAQMVRCTPSKMLGSVCKSWIDKAKAKAA